MVMLASRHPSWPPTDPSVMSRQLVPDLGSTTCLSTPCSSPARLILLLEPGERKSRHNPRSMMFLSSVYQNLQAEDRIKVANRLDLLRLTCSTRAASDLRIHSTALAHPLLAVAIMFGLLLQFIWMKGPLHSDDGTEPTMHWRNTAFLHVHQSDL
jgi:hypothetical protein